MDGKSYLIIFKAAVSYVWKTHPYMTTWIIVCIAVGIYEGITGKDIAMFFSCILAGIAPVIIKYIGRALLCLDPSERFRYEKKKSRSKELFMKHLQDCIEKEQK